MTTKKPAEDLWATFVVYSTDAEDALENGIGGVWEALTDSNVVAITISKPEIEDLEFVVRQFLKTIYTDEPCPPFEKVREPNAAEAILEDSRVVAFCKPFALSHSLLSANLQFAEYVDV